MKFIWSLAVGAILLAGCGRKSADPVPEAVFVDTSRLASLLPTLVVPASKKLTSQLSSDRSSISALPGRSLFVGDSGRIVREAEDLIESEQKLALEQAQRRLESSLLKKAEKLHLAGKPLLDRELGLIAEAELSAIQVELAKHSAIRQPLVFELGKRRGHPDLSRASRKFGAIRKETFPNEEPRVEELRRLISFADDAFLQTKEKIRTESRKQTQEAKGSYQARWERARAQALADAARQARVLVSQSNARIDPQSLLVLSSNLPPRSAAQISLPPVAVSVAPLPGPSALRPSTQLLKDLIPIWAKTRHYQIVESRAAGRDGTSELMQWLKSYSIGR